MKKVLIIGASNLQLPAIMKAKEMGYYVGVVDYNPNAIGVTKADEYFNVSTIDINGIVEVSQRFNPNGIMTLATDMPMRSVAKACEVCGLPGISYDTAIKATDKGEMIKAFEANGVEHPWYYIISTQNDLKESLGMITFPCIMKPTDNAGSRGVVLCHNWTELERNYHFSHHESRSGAVIIEEYLQGPEFSVEVIVIDGEPHIIQITDKLTTGAPHFVEMGHSQPSSLNEINQEMIKSLAYRACKAIGISYGPAHVEIILTKDGPKMVELGARLGGDCITTHLVPLSTGIDMVEAAINIACGEEVNLHQKVFKGSAIRYFDTHSGIIKAIKGVEEAKMINGVKEISIYYQIGDNLPNIESSTDRLGFVIAQADDAIEAIKTCETAMSKIEIVIE